MTALEVVLISLLWLIVGLFIAFKRDWYDHGSAPDSFWCCFFAVIFTPLNLIITFIRIFCVAKWDNTNT